VADQPQVGRPGRSLLVTLIALFEFARAALILLIGLNPWILRGANLVSNVAVQVVTANDPRNQFLRVYPWQLNSDDLDNILGLLGCTLLAVPFAAFWLGTLAFKELGTWIYRCLVGIDRCLLDTWPDDRLGVAG
jgi:hypothetical protein